MMLVTKAILCTKIEPEFNL